MTPALTADHPCGMMRRVEQEDGMAETVSYSDFERVEIRVGTIVDAQPFPAARKPACITGRTSLLAGRFAP